MNSDYYDFIGGFGTYLQQFLVEHDKKVILEFLNGWIKEVLKKKKPSIADIELNLRLSDKRNELEGEV